MGYSAEAELGVLEMFYKSMMLLGLALALTVTRVAFASQLQSATATAIKIDGQARDWDVLGARQLHCLSDPNVKSHPRDSAHDYVGAGLGNFLDMSQVCVAWTADSLAFRIDLHQGNHFNHVSEYANREPATGVYQVYISNEKKRSGFIGFDINYDGKVDHPIGGGLPFDFLLEVDDSINGFAGYFIPGTLSLHRFAGWEIANPAKPTTNYEWQSISVDQNNAVGKKLDRTGHEVEFLESKVLLESLELDPNDPAKACFRFTLVASDRHKRYGSDLTSVEHMCLEKT